MKNKTPKRDKAKKMLTKSEKESNTPLFDGVVWQERKKNKHAQEMQKLSWEVRKKGKITRDNNGRFLKEK
jgi:hypothetical protein